MTALGTDPTSTGQRGGYLEQRGRIAWVDGARGLAICGMVVLHALTVAGVAPRWFDLYPMRFVAPLFLFLVGMLWRPGWRRRHWQVLGAAVATSTLAIPLGFPQPNILPLILGAVLVMPWVARFPVAWLAVCLVQVSFWPMPDWWSGYQPGFIVGFVLLGHVLPADGVVRTLGEVGSELRLGLVGRWPLTFYVGHLLVLVVAVAVASW